MESVFLDDVSLRRVAGRQRARLQPLHVLISGAGMRGSHWTKLGVVIVTGAAFLC